MPKFNGVQPGIHRLMILLHCLRVFHENNILVGVITPLYQLLHIPDQTVQGGIECAACLDDLSENTNTDLRRQNQHSGIQIKRKIHKSSGKYRIFLIPEPGFSLPLPCFIADLRIRSPSVYQHILRVIEPHILSIPEIRNGPSKIPKQTVYLGQFVKGLNIHLITFCRNKAVGKNKQE